MRALLDINVLLALADAAHQHHERARDWLIGRAEHGWASCPLTQNGFIRILSQPGYPRPVPVATAIGLLAHAANNALHSFWPDSVSLLDPTVVTATHIHGPRQLTDLYLLALAVAHRGCLATFDGAIAINAIAGATPEHLVVL